MNYIFIFFTFLVLQAHITPAQNEIVTCIPGKQLMEVKSLLRSNATSYFLPVIYDAMNDLSTNPLYKINTIEKNNFISNLIRQNFTSESSNFFDFFIKNKYDDIPTIKTILYDLYVLSSDYSFTFSIDTSSVYVKDDLFWGHQNGEYFHYLLLIATTNCIKKPIRDISLDPDTITQDLVYFFRFPINTSDDFLDHVLESDDQKLRIWQVLSVEKISEGNKVKICEFPEIPQKYQPEIKSEQKTEISNNTLQGYGNILIDSDPRGASISIKGNKSFNKITPYKEDDFRAGICEITLTKKGYEDVKDYFEILPNTNNTYFKKLNPKDGFLKIETSENPDVFYVDSKVIPYTYGDSIELPIGDHTIKITKKGFLDDIFIVKILPGETYHEIRLLQEKKCTVTFYAPENYDGQLRPNIIVNNNPELSKMNCRYDLLSATLHEITLKAGTLCYVKIFTDNPNYFFKYDTIDLSYDNCPIMIPVILPKARYVKVKVEPKKMPFQLFCMNEQITKDDAGKYKLPVGENIPLIFKLVDSGQVTYRLIRRNIYSSTDEINIDFSEEGILIPGLK